MAKKNTPESLIEIDATKSLIEKKIASDNVFIVEEYSSPRTIFVKGFNKPLKLVSVLDYLNFLREGQSVDKTPGLEEFAKESKEALKTILKPGDKISLQTMPDSYYYDDKAIRAYNERDVDVIAYIGDKPLQEILVERGIVIYNNTESFRLDEVYLSKGEIDRTLAEVLKSAEIIAAYKKQGFWQDKYSYYEFKSRAIGQLNKTFEGNRKLLEERVKQINEARLNRAKSTKSPEERKKEVIEEKKRQKESFNRTYSNSSLGEHLSYLAKQYFPRQKSGDIISGIVSGIYPKSAMQIGALWSGIPTFEEEINGLGAASHPVEIVEIRKDGDVKPILGQGFLSMVMGNRPPDEGLTLIFTCSTRGIETFIAPLLTQFRMDPIVPVRNIHIARFARPIFSNRDFYSRIFGKLPKDITNLVNPDGTYTVKDEGSVRELSRLLDYMYLSVPIYIAVRRVQVNNLENNSGSYTITVECQITDVSENFGDYPTYFSTIDDAFQVHEKRASVIDKVDSESAIRHIAEQIGSGHLMDIYTEQASKLEANEESTLSKIEYIKSSAMPTLFPGDTEGDYKNKDNPGEVEKGSVLVGYILKENKLVEVPAEITIEEAIKQARGTYVHKYANVKNAKNKVGRFLSYKPAFGTANNWKLAKTLLGLSDLKFSDEKTMREVYRYFSLYRDIPSKIPVPISGSKRIRNGFVYKDDLTPNSQSLKSALKVEKESVLDPSYISSYTDPISGLFAVTPDNLLFSAYDYNFSNYRKEALIGTGNFPIIKPFELCSVTNSSFGEAGLSNLMEFEYGIGIGLPSVHIKPISSNKLGISILSDTYSLVGNLKEVGQSLAVFLFGPDGILPNSPISKVLLDNLKDKKNYFAELNSTFSHSISSNLSDGKGNVLTKNVDQITGTLGSLKFNSSLYKTITSVKTERGNINSAGRTIQKELINQRYEVWNQERVDHIIGSVFKKPLKFDISINTGTSIQKVNVGITNILRSQSGSLLFILEVQDKEKTILPLRTVKFQDTLVTLIADYVRAIPKGDTKVKINNVVNKSLEDIKASIRNIIQSIVSKNTKDPLLDKSTPNVLTNITQVLGVTKSKIGTKFIDESEPYVFALMYQLGRVEPGKFDMTFRIRPDRVPYVRPDFLLTDVTTMEMEIFRAEPPKEETRIEAYTRELQRNEEAVRRTSTKEGLNAEVFQLALVSMSEIDKTINPSDKNSVQAGFKNPIFVLAGIQALLLRYLDYVYSAHVVSKAGQELLQKGVRITNPEREKSGLKDVEVTNLLKNIKNDIIQNKISKIEKKFKSLSKKDPASESTNKLIEANIRSLLRIISDVDSRIADARNSKNEPFISAENIRRMVRYAQIRGLGEIFLDTRSILEDIFRIYENTINILLDPSKLRKLYTYKAGEIDLSRGDNSLATEILNLNGRLSALLNITQAIRLASGDSLDFVKRKKLTLKKPIPSIGVVEEYGISSPIKAPGKKKATYQVIGSTATTAYIQFRTNISELYISETSKLSDLVNEEEGMDAIYNMIREPSDITTIYNMMRSGRALVRDATVFTNGSTTSIRSVAGSQVIENAFRLVRRASINSAQADAASVLVGLTEPHVQIKEPLLMALGLSKFVAKTTKLSSATDTTSWKVDVFLLPYEAGYTTNRNLRKLNRAVSNETIGDIASWLNAADSLFAQRFIGIEDKALKDVISEKGRENTFDLRRAEALIRISKMATSAVFSTMVAVHAMYKAKQKILRGLEPINLVRPKDYEDVTSSFSSLSDTDVKTLAENNKVRSRNGLSELDLSPNIFASSVIYGGIGQVTNLPIGTFGEPGPLQEILNKVQLVGGIVETGAFLGSLKKEGFKIGKTVISSKALGALSNKAGNIVLQASILNSFYLGFKGDKLIETSSEKFTENIKNNINVVIPLSQDFALYALEFIQDFAFAESKGQGQAFIELIAREAESVVQNAGDVSGLGILAYTNTPVDSESAKAPTAMGYILSTYPISEAFKDLRSEEYFRTSNSENADSKLVERISILVINANAFGKSGEVSSTFMDDKWKRMYKDFYPESQGDKSFFGSYVAAFSDREGAQSPSVLKTDIDTCGEDLLSLIVDGQVAMYDTDIYSIALAPKYILADVPFYYNGIRAIWGRLKVNHFATYLLSSEYASSISMRLAPFSLATSRDKSSVGILKSMENIGISVSKFKIKKTKNHSKIKEFVNLLFKDDESVLSDLLLLSVSFPLANGRQIAFKIVNAYETYKAARRDISQKSSVKGSDSQLYSSQILEDVKRAQASLSEITRKMMEESPPEKRKLFKPAPVVYSVNSVLSIGNEGEDIGKSYVIPGSSNFPSQKVSSLVEQKTSLSNISFILDKVKESLKEQISWIIDSYTILIDGTTESDLKKADSVSVLREAILTQLSVDRALQLGISVEQAKEEYISEINRYFNFTDSNKKVPRKEAINPETLENIQRACDEIVLYSNNNLSGRDVIFSEYSQFVSTFRQLMMLKPMLYSKENALVDIFRLDDSRRFAGELIGNDTYTFSYKSKSRKSVWDKAEIDIFNSLTREVHGNGVTKRFLGLLESISLFANKVKEGNRNLKYSTLSYIDFSNDEMLRLIASVHSYFYLFYGIERPEYVPSVFYVIDYNTKTDGGNIYGLARSDISIEMLRSYSYGYSKTFWEKLNKTLYALIIGDAAPFTLGAYVNMLFFAITVVLSIKMALIAAIIVVVAIIVVGFFLMFYNAPKVDNIEITATFLSSLKAKIPFSNLSTSPLFTGMKALLEVASAISEMDLLPVSKYARSNKLLPSGIFRSNIYVYPPDISSSIQKSEFILQDTLSYLTVPLIMKRKATFATDVLSPGGHIIPSVDKVNENAKAISTTALIQESFCRDELESLPEYLAVQKAKAQGISSDKAAFDILAPNDPSDINTGYFEGFKNFLDNIQGIFIGEIKESKVAGKPAIVISSDYMQKESFELEVTAELGRLYRYLSVELIPSISSGTGTLERKLPKNRSSIANIQQVEEAFISYAGSFFDLEKYRVSEKFVYSLTGNSFWRGFEKLVGKISTFANEFPDKNDITFAYYYNIREFLKVLNSTLDFNPESKYGAENFFSAIKKLESPLLLFPLVPEASAGSTVPGTIYSRSFGRPVVIEGVKRGTDSSKFFFWGKSDIAVIRESTASARSSTRTGPEVNLNDCAFIKLQNFSFLGSSMYSGGAAIIKTKNIEGYNILSNRWNYIFASRLNKEESVNLSRNGEALIRASEVVSKFIANASSRVYMLFNLADNASHALSFIELYALKLAYEKVDDPNEAFITVTWQDIIDALTHLGCFLKFNGYVGIRAPLLEGFDNNTSVAYGRNNKPLLLKNVTSAKDLVHSSTTSAKDVNTVFAATAGLSTQFVIDKINRYLDSQSGILWENMNRFNREVKILLCSPLRLYPVAKVYFIKKGKSETILYDDLYTYADVLSVKIFESSKSPGTVAIIKLANTENKLDNIIAARSNTMSPFETRAKNEDELSGILIKPGLRMIVYLGYGNVLTEEEKFLFEVETSQQEPDGTYTIYGRGPGWVLNNRMNQSTGPKEVNKVITVDWREVNQILPIASETDIEIAESSNPRVAVAKNLLIYGLIEKGKLDRFGRLGSVTNELSETILSSLPPNIVDSYGGLIQRGIAVSQTDLLGGYSEWLKAAGKNIESAIAGITFVPSTPELYLERSVAGDTKLIRQSSVARNIFPNAGFAVSTGIVDDFAMWLRKISIVPESAGSVWRIVNETYEEFIKEVTLNVPNVRSFVRSFNNDGSLIVGQTSEYYSMYTPKTLTSRLLDRMRSEILSYRASKKLKTFGFSDDFHNKRDAILKTYNKTVEELLAEGRKKVAIGGGGVFLEVNLEDYKLSNIAEKESNKISGIYRGLYKILKNSFVNESARESIAEIFTATITALISSDLDLDRVSRILKKLDSGTSLNILSVGAAAGAVDLYEQLKSSENIFIILDAIVLAYIGELDDPSATKEPLSNSQKIAKEMYKNIDKSDRSAKGILERLQILFIGIDRLIEASKDNLELALEIGWSSRLDKETILKAAEIKNGNRGLIGQDDGDGSYGFFRRFVFCLTIALARFYNNKLTKLEMLAPEKRKIQEEHYVFSGRDIIHNDITTMSGYNEGEFVFEKIGSVNTSLDTINNLAGLILKVERFPFYVDPVSAYEGNTFDYVAKRMFVNLANPAFFSYVINASGGEESIMPNLTLMASNQMCRLIQDWYGGSLYTFGDASKRPCDVIHLTDEIRDMYGPFEIKEAVYSFDIDGFTTNYSPSVLTSVDPRKISSQEEVSNAVAVFTAIGVGVLGLATILARKRIVNLIRAVPGVPKLLFKTSNALTKIGIGGGKAGLIANIISKIIVTPLMSTTKYATKALKQSAKRFASITQKSDVRGNIEQYSKALGFKNVEEFQAQAIKDFDTYIEYLSDLKVLTPEQELENLVNLLKTAYKDLPGVGKEISLIKSVDDYVNLVIKYKNSVKNLDNAGVFILRERFCVDMVANLRVVNFKDPLSSIYAKEGIKDLASFGEKILNDQKLQIQNVAKSFAEVKEVLSGTFINQMSEDLSNLSKCFGNRSFKVKGNDDKLKGAYDSLETFYTKYFSKENINNPKVRRILDPIVLRTQKIIEDAGPGKIEKAREQVFAFYEKLRKAKVGDVVEGVQVTDDMYNFFRQASESVEKLAEGFHGKLISQADEAINELVNSLKKADFDPLVENPEIVRRLDGVAAERIAERQKRINEIERVKSEKLKEIREIEKKTNKTKADEEKIKELKDEINNPNGKIESELREIRKEIKSIEENKYSLQSRSQLAESYRISKQSLSTPESKDFYTGQVTQEANEMMYNALFAAGLSARKVENTITEISYNTFKTTNSALFTPKVAFYSVQNATPGKGLLGAAIKAFSFYSSFSFIRDIVGESIQDFALRLGAKEASDAVKTHFLVYKGEPYIANLEGLTKGSASLIADGTTYFDFLASRFSGLDRDLTTIMNSIVGNTLKSNLTQYTDLITKQTISDEFFTPFDSEYKFGVRTEEGGAAVDGSVARLNDKPHGFFIGATYTTSLYGWRKLTSDVQFHDGIDIAGTNSSRQGKNSIIESNKIYAVEDGIVFFNFFGAKFSEFNDSLTKNNPYDGENLKKGPPVSITLIGLKTGLVFEYRHCYPLLDGQNFDEATQKANTSDVYYVGSGTKLGFHGPFGSTTGPHAHISVYKSSDDQNNKFIVELKKALGSSSVGKVTSSTEVVKLLKSISWSPSKLVSKGFALVNPEPLVKELPGFVDINKIENSNIKLQLELRKHGATKEADKKIAIDFYKSRGLL